MVGQVKAAAQQAEVLDDAASLVEFHCYSSFNVTNLTPSPLTPLSPHLPPQVGELTPSPLE